MRFLWREGGVYGGKADSALNRYCTFFVPQHFRIKRLSLRSGILTDIVLVSLQSLRQILA
jgi:hypothetical protein